MKNKTLLMLRLLAFLFLHLMSYYWGLNWLKAQGCSDAGICSAGSFSHNKEDVKFQFGFSNQFGLGENNVKLLVSQIEFNARLTNKKYLQAKIPYVFTSGDLGTVHGIGDIIVSYSYSLLKNKVSSANVLLGLKVSTGRTNLGSINGKDKLISLPMAYQPGLGSEDVLVGFDFRLAENFKIASGLQIPLVFNNLNSFDTAAVALADKSRQYFTSSQLIRSPDLVFRLEKTFNLGKKWSIKASFIPVIHLKNDKYFDAKSQSKKEIINSAGVTLNGISGIGYSINKSAQILLNVAAPFLTREVRPDGLTRKFILGFNLKYFVL